MEKKKSETILKALDTLALALTGHKHQWTDEEKKLYVKASNILVKLNPETA